MQAQAINPLKSEQAMRVSQFLGFSKDSTVAVDGKPGFVTSRCVPTQRRGN